MSIVIYFLCVLNQGIIPHIDSNTNIFANAALMMIVSADVGASTFIDANIYDIKLKTIFITYKHTPNHHLPRL